MNKNKGFTLIELLVVIAIIVILAMIVFPGVRTATQKAKDARIVSEMSQIRTQAEIVYTNNGNYTGIDTNADIVKLTNDVKAQNGSVDVTWNIPSGGASYMVYSPINEKTSGGATQYICIDSDSTTYKGATAPTGTACPAS